MPPTDMRRIATFWGGRMMEAGGKAPDFCLVADDDETVCLKDFKGMWVVLYFYVRKVWPKAKSSGHAQEVLEALREGKLST